MIHHVPVLIRRLLIRPGAIGDFIVSLPALTSLRADYTEVWCKRENVPLARFADRAVPLADTGIDRLGLLNDQDTVDSLRAFDSIISWYGAANPGFRATVEKLGLPFRFLAALPQQGGPHAVDYYNAQARSLGAQPQSRYPSLDCPPQPRRFAAIHPFASGPRKQALFACFEAAAQRLAKTMPVEWLRGPEDSLNSAHFVENLYDLACWLRGARILVANDCGISHLAAAAGTPCFVLFSGSDPRVWAPRGPAVHTTFSKVSETFNQSHPFE